MGLSDVNASAAEKPRGEGRTQTRLEAELIIAAWGLVKILDFRGVQLSLHERERITTCRDPDRLSQWFRRVAAATTAADVFADGDPEQQPPEAQH